MTGKLFCGLCKSPMVGVSGTGKNGQLHHYYMCQQRRQKKSCNKQNVHRDVIERQVAAAMKEYILRDDVIEWLADKAIAWAKDYRGETGIGALEAQLAENKKATKNLLAAIEMGIITESTKERLLELEREQAMLVSRLCRRKCLLGFLLTRRYYFCAVSLP